MTEKPTRRGFLKLLGIGTAVAVSHDELLKQIQSTPPVQASDILPADAPRPPGKDKAFISTRPMASMSAVNVFPSRVYSDPLEPTVWRDGDFWLRPSNARVQMRRGTASEATKANIVLAAGEPGFETDTGQLKIGDGKTYWNQLPYRG